jgi:penicillin-binding protein 2
MTEVSSRIRLSVIGVIIAALFFGLLARLWFLQVAQSSTYSAQTTANRIRVIQDPGVRGRILDRNGNVLVADQLVNTVELQRGLTATVQDKTVRNLAAVLATTPAALTKTINTTQAAAYQPIPISENVPYATLVDIKERPQDFPGITATQRSVRVYPYGALGAQLLGYVGSVSAGDLQAHKGQGYIPSDVIGKDGAEEVFESELRGSPHYEKFEVDSRGRIVHILQNRPAKAGNDVQLTMDVNIQQEAEAALAQGIAEVRSTHDTTTGKNYRAPGGAAVVLDARDGSVVAMASSPSYPVNQFTSGIPPALFKLYSSPLSGDALLNRATQGQYPPGSTFKMLTATAALDHGIATPAFTFDDKGCLTFGGQQFCNAGKEALGTVNMPEAITVSSDLYFYNLGFLFWQAFEGNQIKALGDQYSNATPDQTKGYGIQETARAFGLGRPTGVGLPEEAPGRIPDLEFKKSVNKTNPDPFSRTWLPGDEANVATGQGDVLATPLQMADAYSAFINPDSTLYSPRLASRILTPGGGATVRGLPAENEGKVPVSPTVRAALMPGFLGAVSGAGGTATAAFRGYHGLPIAGKTGTAQQPPPTQDTAWFVGLVNPVPTAPNQPQYVVVVTVEQAGFGGTVAAPIARQIIEALSGNLNPGPVQLAKPQTD